MVSALLKFFPVSRWPVHLLRALRSPNRSQLPSTSVNCLATLCSSTRDIRFLSWIMSVAEDFVALPFLLRDSFTRNHWPRPFFSSAESSAEKISALDSSSTSVKSNRLHHSNSNASSQIHDLCTNNGDTILHFAQSIPL